MDTFWITRMKTISYSRRSRKMDVGATIDLSIRRADGSVQHLGKFHNFLGSQPFSIGRLNIFASGNINIYARDTPGIYSFTGTWQQVGTAISRVTNVGPNNDLTASGWTQDDMLVFGTGERCTLFGVTNATTGTARQSQNVAATTLSLYRTWQTGFGRNPATSIAGQSVSGLNGTMAYANGVHTYTLNAPQSMVATSVAYTLHCLVYSYGALTAVGGATTGGIFHISGGIALQIGDAIQINSFVITYTWSSYQPVVFSAPGPILNINQSGRYQRLARISAEESAVTPNRIFLLTNANKIVLPDMLGPATTILAPASYTIKETIVSTINSTVAPSNLTFANNGVESSSSVQGTVVTGGSDIRQIAWGSTTQILGAIEYDADVTIDPGKVLTISTILRMVATLEAP